jgi:uncharacterized membrane protein (DUF2068 family)
MAPRWWWWRHPETLVCGVRDHVVPATWAQELRGGLAPLVIFVEGRRLGRCLRCDAWVDAPVETTPPGELRVLSRQLVPRRGQALRDAIILRAIAVERAIHSVAFGLLAIGLLVLRVDLTGLQSQAKTIVNDAGGGLAGPGQTASQTTILHQVERLLNLRRGTLGVLALTAVVYCVVEGTEAVGLWLERRWAEYLTVIATAGFLPFEVYELTKRVTIVRVTALVINVAVLVYLVWSKHLFGIGGRRRQEEPVGVVGSG